MKNLCFLLPFSVCCGALLAQSSEVTPVVTHQVRFLAAEPGDVAPDATKPLIINTFTIMGDNVTGTPCYSCVTGATTPNLGVLQPSGIVKAGTQYQVNVFLVDQNYTGSCTDTFEVTRKSTVIYSANTTFTENAPTTMLLRTPLTVPTGTTAGGDPVSGQRLLSGPKLHRLLHVYIRGDPQVDGNLLGKHHVYRNRPDNYPPWNRAYGSNRHDGWRRCTFDHRGLRLEHHQVV